MDTPCVIEDLLTRPFKLRSFAEKLQLVQKGRPLPAIPSLMSASQGFTVDKYDEVSWLAGSAKVGALFCWPCLLFGQEKNTWNSVGTIDLDAHSALVADHERAESHIRSFLELRTFGSTEMDSRLAAIRAHNAAAQRNRDVLIRFIDCILYMIKCKLPFEPVRYFDSDTEDNEGYVLGKGNYLATLDFLGEFDPLLKSHLNKSSVFTEKAVEIKNGLIRALAEVLRQHIQRELKAVPFASVLLEEVQTVDSRLLSTVVRFVARDGQIQERFVSAVDMQGDHSKEAVFAHLSGVVDQLGIQAKLVSHSYDGRTVLVSELKGLCETVRAKCPLALLAPGRDRDLQTVLLTSLSHVRESRLSVFSISEVPRFFGHSETQLAALHAFMRREYPDVPDHTMDFTGQPLRTTFALRKELLEYLDAVTEDCEDLDTRFRAEGCVAALESFEGCFYLAFLSSVLGEVGEGGERVLGDADARFDRAWDYATHEAEEDTARPRKRSSDVSPRALYRIQYNKCLQNITAQVTCRLSSLARLRFLGLVDPARFADHRRSFPSDLLDGLRENYPSCFDLERLRSELAVLYSFDLGGLNHPRDLVRGLCARGLEGAVPQAHRLACLCLTIYGSGAGEHESPRHLETWGEQDTDLALLTVEVALLMRVKERPGFYDDVINQLASKEAMPEFVFHTAQTWPADDEPSPAINIVSVESTQVLDPLEDGPQSPVSLMDIKEEPPFSQWTSLLPPVPVDVDSADVKMETDEDAVFAFVDVRGDPLSVEDYKKE